MHADKHLKYFLFALFTMGMFPYATAAKHINSPEETQARINMSSHVLYDFKEVYVGMISDVQFYDISASNVSGNMHITAGEPFVISLQCHSDFSSDIELIASNGQIASTRIFIRFAPTQAGQINADIIHQVQQADEKTLAVAGTGIQNQIHPSYYSTATGRGSQLKSALFQIIRNHQVVSYASLWEHFETTDVTFGGQVWDMYSDTPCQDPPYIFTFVEDQDRGSGGGSEGQFFNREHTMPLSWFGGQQTIMASDLFHIYPADKWVNGQRANYPYGEVNNPTTITRNGSKLGTNTIAGYNGNAFEPIDPYKGDLARSYFYMITRYEDQISNWNYSAEGNNMLAQSTYPGFSSWAIRMLMEWHENDPVSQKEIRRNDAVFAIQGNRNPFIDHPEFVELIWGDNNTRAGNLPENVSIAVFPNPANDMVNMTSDRTIQHIDVFSTSGMLIASYSVNNDHAQICTANIANGLYLIRLRFADNYLTRRLIIQHGN